jgi:oxygen-dependent protoporphyrinogen oxidase
VSSPVEIAVVGGGISGLTAAVRLRKLLGPAASITVYESTTRLGGKLRTVEVAGVPVDVGAEAFLLRRPEAVELVAELGLQDEVVHAGPASPSVRASGRTVALPRRTFMGIPGDAAEVDGVLSAKGVEQVAAERTLPPVRLPAHDVSLGRLLRQRLGDELVDRLVSPLLGGVYGARADDLGLRAVLPALAKALENGAGSITAAAAGLLPPPQAGGGSPVFGTLRGGLQQVAERAAHVADARVELGTPVRELRRTAAGWQVTAAETRSVDGVILAVPAPAARRLLAGCSPEAADAYGRVELASMAVVTVAFPPGTELPESSGLLIEEGQRRSDGSAVLSKAMTFTSRKWPHIGAAGVIMRASVGRFGQAEQLRMTDDALIEGVLADVADLAGVTVEPIDVHVQRWGGGLPCYGPEHGECVAAIDKAVAGLPRLEVAGALLDGVGIPACIATADAAARRLASQVTVPH